ncbi:MAG: VanW family protein [Chloroflexi bacterium]|nr:VanW family protein [Chloroflexota bacterium]
MTEGLRVQTETVAATAAPANRRAWPRLVVGTLFGALAALALTSGLVLAADQQYAGRVLPGVRVAGTDLSGLDPDQATQAVTASLAGYGEGTIVVRTRVGVREIPYAAIGREPDVAPIVAAALAVGRDGEPIDRLTTDVRNALRGVDVAPAVRLDRAALRAAIAAIAAETDLAPVDATVDYSPDGSTVTPAVPGEEMDVDAAAEAAAAALSTTDAPDTVEVEAAYTPVEAETTTQDAEAAVAAAGRMLGPVLLADGKEKWTVTAKTVKTWIGLGTRPDGSFGPVVDLQKAAASVAKLAPKIDREAKSATFLTGKDGKVVGVVAGKAGRTLDPAATAARVAAALLARAADPAIAAAPVQIGSASAEPVLTTEEARRAAPLMKRISTWTTKYEVSERNGFAANITIPTLVIDGTVVGPGEEFDFWKVVGIPTVEQGYKAGGAIINGRTEPTGAFAGGICSCSTTLFNAAVRAGFEILEREAHYYYISRYPLGLDATVWLTGNSGRSMRWRNDTDYPVLIRGFASPGVVRFDLYSVPTGRTVAFSKPVVTNYAKATDVTQYTTSLSPGSSKRVEFPTDGMNTSVTRVVKDKDGKVIRTDTFASRYARVNGLLLIGKKKAAEATPEPSIEDVPIVDGGVVPPDEGATPPPVP